MKIPVEIREILHKVAEKHGTTYEEAEKAYKAQFQTVRNIISSGNPEEPDTLLNMILPNFGKFAIKPGKRAFLEEYHAQKKQSDTDFKFQE